VNPSRGSTTAPRWPAARLALSLVYWRRRRRSGLAVALPTPAGIPLVQRRGGGGGGGAISEGGSPRSQSRIEARALVLEAHDRRAVDVGGFRRAAGFLDRQFCALPLLPCCDIFQLSGTFW
jgi:hypothetical protein